MNHDEINQMLAHAFDPPPTRPKRILTDMPRPRNYPIEPREVLDGWEPFHDESTGFPHEVAVDVMKFLAGYSIQDLQDMHDGASTSVFFKGLIKCFTEDAPESKPLTAEQQVAKEAREIEERLSAITVEELAVKLGKDPVAFRKWWDLGK